MDWAALIFGVSYALSGALGGHLLTYPRERPDGFRLVCGTAMGPFALLVWGIERAFYWD